MDGRNFSDSKLLQDQPGELNTVMKAYQEEKAIRKELEKFVKGKYSMDVLEELEMLKK